MSVLKLSSDQSPLSTLSCPIRHVPVDGKLLVGHFAYINPNGQHITQALHVPCKGETERDMFMARSQYDAMLVDTWCALADAGARSIEYHEVEYCSIWRHAIEPP